MKKRKKKCKHEYLLYKIFKQVKGWFCEECGEKVVMQWEE